MQWKKKIDYTKYLNIIGYLNSSYKKKSNDKDSIINQLSNRIDIIEKKINRMDI